MDEHTVENGCPDSVPGSHKEAVPVLADGRIAPAWLEGREFVPMLLNAGEVLIFTESVIYPLESDRAD